MCKPLIFLILLFIVYPALAQPTAQTDSLDSQLDNLSDSSKIELVEGYHDAKINPSNFILKKEWVRHSVAPAFLLTSSFLVWGKREDIRGVRNRYIPNYENHLDDYLQYAPAVGALGLSFAGKKGRNSQKRQIFSLVVSSLIMAAAVNTVKYTMGVVRPDGSTANSFPSGHTATSFMTATFLHKEYGHINPLYSIAGYTSSSYVGASRSLNNRHWISDILAGAAIGIISTELGYLIVDFFYKNKGDYFSGFTVQDEIKKPSYFSARMGYSFDIDGGKLSALGVESSIEGAYYFSEHWGVLGEVTFGHYPFKSQAWEGDSFELSDVFITPALQYFESMGMFYFMVGPQYAKSLGSIFILQTKATLGGVLGSKAEMSLIGDAKHKNTGIQKGINLPFVDYKPRPAVAGGFGISISAMMTPRIGLSWFADYKYSKITFDITPSTKTFGYQLDYLSEKESVDLNNISSGIRFTAFFD